MRGRCFEVSEGYWRKREPILPDSQLIVELHGLRGTCMNMQKAGWSFLVETCAFTKKQRLLASHVTGISASGRIVENVAYIYAVYNTKYGRKLNAEYAKHAEKEAINLDKLGIRDLLDAILYRQQQEAPPAKPKPKAEIVSLPVHYKKDSA